MQKKLEICCYSVESAMEAQKQGAHRIELCDNYSEGGTTPSLATIQCTVNELDIPVNVIIRPRGGDFLYSHIEYEIIKLEVEILKSLNINGIVIGFLESNGDIDIPRMREIVELAAPLEVTFHRAFDMCRDPFIALEQLVDIGVTRVLTSGGQNKAMEGLEVLSSLVKKAGNRIIIMPGSGVNEQNLKDLINKTNAPEYHSSAKTFEPSKMSYFNKNINMGGQNSIDEYSKVSVNPKSIRKMVDILEENHAH